MYAQLPNDFLEKLPPADIPFTLTISGDDFQLRVHELRETPDAESDSGVEVARADVLLGDEARTSIADSFLGGAELWVAIQDHVPGKSAPDWHTDSYGVAAIIQGNEPRARICDDLLDALMAGRGLPCMAIPSLCIWVMETHFQK